MVLLKVSRKAPASKLALGGATAFSRLLAFRYPVTPVWTVDAKAGCNLTFGASVRRHYSRR